MPRTFTLHSLMIAITLFCILCGLAAAFPDQAIQCAPISSVFLPSLFVWIVLAAFSRRPMPLLWICLGGTFIGLVFTSLFLSGPPMSQFGAIASIAIPSALGALILGGAELADDTLARRQGH